MRVAPRPTPKPPVGASRLAFGFLPLVYYMRGMQGFRFPYRIDSKSPWWNQPHAILCTPYTQYPLFSRHDIDPPLKKDRYLPWKPDRLGCQKNQLAKGKVGIWRLLDHICWCSRPLVSRFAPATIRSVSMFRALKATQEKVDRQADAFFFFVGSFEPCEYTRDL